MSTLKSRFLAKTRLAPNGCLEWTACKNADGYGQIGVVGGKRKSAHHVSWYLSRGVWPTQSVLHTCDNPACVNPRHLYEGDAKQNQADCIARGRKPRGERCSSARLTQAQVDEIRRLQQTRMTLAEIAAKFGVSVTYVNAIARRRVWDDGVLPPLKPWACEMIDVDGVRVPLKDVAEKAGIALETVRARIARGLSGKDLIAGKHRAKRKPYTRR